MTKHKSGDRLVTPLSYRKADHLRIAAGPGVEHAAGSGLGEVALRHRALPGRDLADVDLMTDLLGTRLAAPLFVSAMTGGTPEAETVNRRLAQAAAEHRMIETNPLGAGAPGASGGRRRRPRAKRAQSTAAATAWAPSSSERRASIDAPVRRAAGAAVRSRRAGR